MPKPVTTQDLFDMWQKMVNPGAYPLQSMMFPVMDPQEIETKIAELEAVEHWLRANLNMLQLTVKSLQYQRAMLKGGEKFREEISRGRAGKQAPAEPEARAGDAPLENPALWAWKMMAEATKPSAAPKKKGSRKKS
jgi:hypothetical protein